LGVAGLVRAAAVDAKATSHGAKHRLCLDAQFGRRLLDAQRQRVARRAGRPDLGAARCVGPVTATYFGDEPAQFHRRHDLAGIFRNSHGLPRRPGHRSGRSARRKWPARARRIVLPDNLFLAGANVSRIGRKWPVRRASSARWAALRPTAPRSPAPSPAAGRPGRPGPRPRPAAA
jgi:hypothetical protein